MTVVDLYTIQLLGDTEDKRALEFAFDVEALMAETEENLTDLLPAGYRARIRRWDHPDPEEDQTQEEA